MPKFEIRFANEKDVPVILGFIRELAEFEKLLHEVTATEDILRQNLFEQKGAEVLIGCLDDVPIGYALFFHSFSTFLGKRGIYLEDLYIQPKHRGNGYGKKFLSHLAQVAVDRGYGRLEWSVLDWNQKAIDVYLSVGAVPMSDWTVFRVTGEALPKLAKS